MREIEYRMKQLEDENGRLGKENGEILINRINQEGVNPEGANKVARVVRVVARVPEAASRGINSRMPRRRQRPRLSTRCSGWERPSF